MMTVTSNSLNAAILAMHSYNVGPEAHLLLESSNIGDYSYLSLLSGSDGFSAAAFANDGLGYIAIRGTNASPLTSFIADALNGYTIGAGLGAHWSSQATASLQFYQSVATELGTGGIFGSGITLVGHSLGGGLAGYVAAIYGQQAYLFDNMTFVGSAVRDHNAAVNPITINELYLRDLIYPDDVDIAPLDGSGIHQYATVGDFLWAVRTAAHEDGSVEYLSSNYLSSSLSSPANEYHSMALQVNLQWAQLNATRSSWVYGAQDVFKAYFDPATATYVQPASDLAGTVSEAITVLQEAIAYSAVIGEVQPFGNAALYSLFDDMADIGDANNTNIGNQNVVTSPALNASQGIIAQIAVEFAAQQAFGDVTLPMPATSSGVLSVLNNSTLNVDLSSEKWDFTGTAYHSSGYKLELIETSVNATIGMATLSQGLSAYIGATGSLAQDALSLISSVSFSLPGATELAIPTTSGLNMLFLQAGTGANAQGAGEDRVIIGSSFSDSIYGGSENDVLFGGAGQDYLSGGQGTNIIFGGAGADHLKAEGFGDLLWGGAGNDLIELNAVSATIQFGIGDGSDTVQFNLSAGDYSLKLKDLNPDDIDVIGGGFNAYAVYADTGMVGPNGIWYQFLTIRVKDTGDQITFLENGLGSQTGVGPTDDGPPDGYNRGRFNPAYPQYDGRESTSEGQLDRIVFADGTVWDQASIWAQVGIHDTWAYSNDNVGPRWGYGYAEHNENDYVSYVHQNYLQALSEVII